MSAPKKVMLLTYYWPPAGGAGVQRWLKMSKYLAREFDLTVYHPENADYPIRDESLIKEIPENIHYLKGNIREPYALASKLSSKNKTYQKGQIDAVENQSTISKISLWMRANFFIPDARAWWIMPSYHRVNKFIQENPQDVIITTGPPHSVHIIGLRLKLRHPNLKWIADFRDPWTDIDYFDKLPLTNFALKKHRKLEKEVLKYADVITTVSESWASDLSEISNKFVEVIYNGFDKKDFKTNIDPAHKFLITYAGSLNDDRNPSQFWEILNELCKVEEFKNELEVRLIGNISDHVKPEIRKLPDLIQKTHFIPYLPHNEVIEELQNAQILLLLINDTPNAKGIIPGKLFEYMAANRRILCLGNQESDISNIISETHSGIVVNRDDSENLKQTLEIWFKEYQNGILNKSRYHNNNRYSRKQAAMEFIQLIENI